MEDLRVFDVITPDDVTPLAFGRRSKLANASGVPLAESINDLKGLKLKAIPLRYEVKFDDFSPSDSGKTSTYKKASFIIEGLLDKISIEKKIDYAGGKLTELKIGLEGDLSVDIRAEVLGEILMGKSDKFWKDAEKKAVLGGFSTTGLKHIDKKGKIPIAGIVLYPSAAFLMTGSLPSNSIKYQPVGMLIWVYLDLKGILSMNGKMGIAANTHIKFAFDKKAEDKFNVEMKKGTKKRNFLELPYFNGRIGFQADMGVSLDVDLFVKGLRLATASGEIGASYKREFKTSGDVSYGLKNSFDDPFEWSGGGVCLTGSSGLGLKLHAGASIGYEYKKDKDSHDSTKGSIGGVWDYPEQKDIDKALRESRYGRVGHSLWFVTGDTRTCFNLKTIVSDIAKLTTHLDRYRASYLSTDNLKDLSDTYYAQAYLAKRIYDDKAGDVGTVKSGWKLIKLDYQKSNGFKAALYENTYTHKYAIVYGGTTASLPNMPANAKYYDTMLDLLTDATLVANYGWKPRQALAALGFLGDSEVKSHIDAGEVAFIAGHSLGGGLAQLAGIYTGIDTVTINTAPMPLDNETAAALVAKGVAHPVADQNLRTAQYTFDLPDVMENIMMREDPISSISTLVMDIEGEDSFYTTVAKTLFRIDDALKMDFMIAGHQTYLPFDSSNSSYTLMQRHSSETVLDIFKSHTHHASQMDVQISGDTVTVNGVTVTDKDGNAVTTHDATIGIGDEDGNMVASGDIGEALKGLAPGTYTVLVTVTLDDGREVWIQKTITITGDKPVVKLELLNADTCKTTKHCELKLGILSEHGGDGGSIDWGDGTTSSTTDGTSGGADRDYNYWTLTHDYAQDGTYWVNGTTQGGTDSVSLDVVVGGAPATTTQLKKTGQTKSYDEAGNEVARCAVKDDGCYQTGVTPSYTRANDVVTDNVTGLQWQDNEEAKTITRDWEEAQTYCANLTLDGGGWRLPTIDELMYIADRSKRDPAINPTFKNTRSDGYWSSTSIVGDEDYAWGVYFYYGNANWDGKSNSHYVRCVRAGE